VPVRIRQVEIADTPGAVLRRIRKWSTSRSEIGKGHIGIVAPKTENGPAAYRVPVIDEIEDEAGLGEVGHALVPILDVEAQQPSIEREGAL
jgi:hypothetical protein